MKEYYIAKGEEKTGPFSLDEMKIQTFYADTLIWKEGWQDWIKASDVPELQQLINNAPPPIKLKEDAPIEDEVPKKDTQSIVDKAYTRIGLAIDNLLEKNRDKVGQSAFYTYLNQARTFYKNLSEKKQRGLSFFISTLLIFLLASLIWGSFAWGYDITKYWIAFIALNQIKAIASIINTVTELVIFFTLVFLPEALKRPISRFAKNISILILAYFFGWVIAPIYIVYRIAILFIGSDENPVESANSNVTIKRKEHEN
ncbi:MAG: DUF4339 domain-containing protein [Trichodesmium erythraeum GBRTRLIN201]|nr:DUF4339 domain-containing protein [Trichodesmium erythraeum GBRTRLIN201]